MAILDTKHKRKSAAITSIVLFLLVLVMFNFGMTYLDPPEEYGLAINFGDANVGMGDPVQNTKQNLKPAITEKEVLPQKEQQEIKETTQEVQKEDILTNETSKEVPVIEKKEEKKQPEKKVVKEETPIEKPTPKPSQEIKDALNKLLNGNISDGKPKGEGDDAIKGLKGTKKGAEYSTKYYGKAGEGADGNYNLAGRKALSKPIEQPDCQEEGIVVVRIEVAKNGKVISAIPGVKGSTNTAACLLKPAKQAALQTTWNADKEAPTKQIGTIIYKFTLTK